MSLRTWLFEPSSKSLLGRVNALESRFQPLSDSDLAAATPRLKERLAKGEAPLSLLTEAFAAMREAARRSLGMRHFDVQILGGIELARGRIVEMKTGEGKTLVATLPAYLHALAGKGVHIITVNDYLAARDAEWMGPAYRALGLTVGVIQEDMGSSLAEETRRRQAAYAADITYVTNSEVVFDFLRDNLVDNPDELVQRGFHFGIVDEMDLLLIDEAQTPLIISGKGDDDTGLFVRVMRVIRSLRAGEHFKAERRTRTAGLTEAGLAVVEKDLGVGSLSAPGNLPVFHAVHQCLQARAVYDRDVDYIVESGNIYLIDEHTGRVSPDKRFSNGLHQALEAKEGVTIKSEDITLAKTSYQQFFRGYANLSGMTGTAYSEKEEFNRVYFRKVVRLPTNRPLIRKDYAPVVYKTLAAKHRAVLEDIREMHELGRPVLVGTVSVQESEQLDALLTREGIKHHVLNAKNHAREAEIVAQAGRLGAVTISTNMAGRGTDIMLGGSPKKLAEHEAAIGTPDYEAALARYAAVCKEEQEKVVAAGGLHIIGTGEHDSVRIDDQLRGRAGRQGDPGSSIFLLSLDDPVYRKFGEAHGLAELREALADWDEDEPITAIHLLHQLKVLREKVEVENQAIRNDVLKYDMVVHERRQAVWAWRTRLLFAESTEAWRDSVAALIEDLVGRESEYLTKARELDAARRNPEPEEGDDETPAAPAPQPSAPQNEVSPVEHVRAVYAAIRGMALTPEQAEPILTLDDVAEALWKEYEARLGTEHDEALHTWERRVLLGLLDRLWTQFLTDLERIEEGIGLRGYGNLDPVVEFRREAAILYDGFMRDVITNALRAWQMVDPHREPAPEAAPAAPSELKTALRKGPRQGKEPGRVRAIDKLPSVGRGGRKHRARG